MTRKRSVALLLGALALVFAFLTDEITKLWALSSLKNGQTYELLGSYLTLKLVHNPGAALSLGQNMTWLVTLFSLGIEIVILYYWIFKTYSYSWALAFGIILGGGIANLGDRFFRAPGFLFGRVVDFISYKDFFIGNVADIWIVLGAVIIFVLALTNVPLKPIELAKNIEN